MSLVTNWGYTLTGADALTDFLTDAEFDAFTAGKYDGDARIAPNINSVSQAVRNYCGWHLYPSLACEMRAALIDKRVTVVGPDLLIQLPARYVSGITSVTIGGEEYSTFTFETNGTLRVYDVHTRLERYSEIVVVYTAGLPDGLMGAIKELAANRVTHALASSYGVTSEAAGGVSITYNASWAGNTRATALTDDSKEVLTPYRLEGVF